MRFSQATDEQARLEGELSELKEELASEQASKEASKEALAQEQEAHASTSAEMERARASNEASQAEAAAELASAQEEIERLTAALAEASTAHELAQARHAEEEEAHASTKAVHEAAVGEVQASAAALTAADEQQAALTAAHDEALAAIAKEKEALEATVTEETEHKAKLSKELEETRGRQETSCLFWRHFRLNTEHLPRQARDKHRKRKTRAVFSQSHRYAGGARGREGRAPREQGKKTHIFFIYVSLLRCHFILEMIIFYQDRLRTNTGKALKKRDAFSLFLQAAHEAALAEAEAKLAAADSTQVRKTGKYY